MANLSSTTIYGDLKITHNAVATTMYFEASFPGDKISLYGNGLDDSGGYCLGIEASTLYYKSSIYHRWYSGDNADGGTSDVMELDGSGNLSLAGSIYGTGSLDIYSPTDSRVLLRARGTSGYLGWYDDNANSWIIRYDNGGDLEFGSIPSGDIVSSADHYFGTQAYADVSEHAIRNLDYIGFDNTEEENHPSGNCNICRDDSEGLLYYFRTAWGTIPRLVTPNDYYCNIVISDSSASGGANGDIWFEY